jgi:hypothetical protein
VVVYEHLAAFGYSIALGICLRMQCNDRSHFESQQADVNRLIFDYVSKFEGNQAARYKV